jgi:hypothetical protein
MRHGHILGENTGETYLAQAVLKRAEATSVHWRPGDAVTQP